VHGGHAHAFGAAVGGVALEIEIGDASLGQGGNVVIGQLLVGARHRADVLIGRVLG
jgi:hypothetical protein